MLLPSKNRSTTAWRSVSFKPAIAASSNGAICLQTSASIPFGVTVGFIIVQDGLHIGLLFTAGAPDGAPDKRHRRQPRGLIQPAGENDSSVQMPGFSREDDEDGLRDFLGLMRIAGVAQRDRINLVDVPRDERGKGLLGIALDVFAQQGGVIQFLHLPLNAADSEKVTSIFQKNLKRWEVEAAF